MNIITKNIEHIIIGYELESENSEFTKYHYGCVHYAEPYYDNFLPNLKLLRQPISKLKRNNDKKQHPKEPKVGMYEHVNH